MNVQYPAKKYQKIILSSGFATTHVVDFLWVCRTSYHLLISPPPTKLPNSLPAPYHSASILNMPRVKDSHCSGEKPS